MSKELKKREKERNIFWGVVSMAFAAGAKYLNDKKKNQKNGKSTNSK